MSGLRIRRGSPEGCQPRTAAPVRTGWGLLDFVNSPNRLKYPEYRAPGSDHWQRISWDEALDRIARLLKDDRDANFVQKTDDGKVVNRWTSTGMLAASAASNETATSPTKWPAAGVF